MDDAVDLGMPGAQRLDRRAIADVGAPEAEAALARQLRQPRLLQRDIIVVVEVVDADHGLAARQQRPTDMRADEAGGAGQEDRHSYASSSAHSRFRSET